MFLANKKFFTLLFVLFVLLYFFQLFRVARNYSQSHAFGDENAHMAGGYFLLKRYKPYKDFSGNHQPLTYIFPAVIQKFAPANSLFLFVGRHRLAIYFYSIFWQSVYLFTFGKFVFFFTLIFEISRYVLLGNKILGEILTMYPLVFLFGAVIKKTIFNQNLRLPEIIIFSFASFLAAFSLLPAWPTIIILNLALLINHRKDKKRLLLQISPLFILILFLFMFVPFAYYFRDTIYDNLTFVIPKMNRVSLSLDYLRMIFLPFSAFRKNPDFINVSIISYLALYLSMLYVALKMKKIMPLLLIIFALVLTNSRNTFIKFGDFHVLPWLAGFFFIPVAFFATLIQHKTHFKRFRKLYIFSLVILLTLTFWLNFIHKADFYGKILFNTKNDLLNENYINYSRSVKYGLAMKTIKNKGDRLFGIANDTLAFWVADLDLAVAPLESYHWQYQLPRFRRQVYEVFKTNPPEFIITEGLAPLGRNDPVGVLVEKRLTSDYINLRHQDKPSELYVFKGKISKITEKQWKELEYYLFKKPSL